MKKHRQIFVKDFPHLILPLGFAAVSISIIDDRVYITHLVDVDRLRRRIGLGEHLTMSWTVEADERERQAVLNLVRLELVP